MSFIYFIAGLTTSAGLMTLLILTLARHKKAGAKEIKLLGELATVGSPLAPEGTVIVHGELWRAVSREGSSITTHRYVRIVGIRGHMLLVELSD